MPKSSVKKQSPTERRLWEKVNELTEEVKNLKKKAQKDKKKAQKDSMAVALALSMLFEIVHDVVYNQNVDEDELKRVRIKIYGAMNQIAQEASRDASANE